MSGALRWLATATAVTLLAGCGSANTNPEQVKANIRLVDSTPVAAGDLAEANWFISREPATLDLDNDAANSQSDLIMANVCERLLQLRPDLSSKPNLAQQYKWATPDTLVFSLRTDVTFHSGKPMTADDVVWSMQRHAADGAAESDEYVNVTSITKTGPAEVTVNLKQPDAVFLQAMAGDAGVVWERAAVEAQGGKFGSPSGTDACSGPFTVRTWASGDRIVLAKAPGYWDSAKASRTGQITFRWADDDAIVNSLVTSAADGAYLENISSATRLATGTGTSISQGPDTRVWSLMATERGGLADARLRKALSLALDRDGISRAAFAGLAQPAKEPVGPGAWGYEKAAFQAAYDKLAGAPAQPDVEAARKLVAEAGQAKPIVVASDGSSIRNVISNALVDAATKIGLQATITQVPAQQYGDFLTKADLRKQADLFSDDYYISKNDPVGFYKNGASNASVNWVLRDPAYDRLVPQARATIDDAARAKLSIDLAQRWADAMPWIPVAQSPSTVALSAKVSGVPASGCYRYYPWAADLGAKAS
jgi:peptide/nickel transport system substrate-binding protein